MSALAQRARGIDAKELATHLVALCKRRGVQSLAHRNMPACWDWSYEDLRVIFIPRAMTLPEVVESVVDVWQEGRGKVFSAAWRPGDQMWAFKVIGVKRGEWADRVFSIQLDGGVQ